MIPSNLPFKLELSLFERKPSHWTSKWLNIEWVNEDLSKVELSNNYDGCDKMNFLLTTLVQHFTYDTSIDSVFRWHPLSSINLIIRR